MNSRPSRIGPLRSGSLALAAVLALGCEPPGPQPPTVDMGVSPTPATVGNARIMITVSDSTATPIVGASVRLEGRPEGSGAVAAQRDAVEESPGRYVVPDFRFMQAGLWSVEVVITPPAGPESRVTREVRVVGGGPS